MSTATFKSAAGRVQMDLASLGGPQGTFPCVLFFDAHGRVDHVDVEVPNKDEIINTLMNAPNSFQEQKVGIELDDGRSVRAELAVSGGFHGDLMGTIFGTFHIKRAVIQTSTAPADGWRAWFLNAHLDMYDYGVTETHEHGWTFTPNEVRFRVAERDWVLIDDAAKAWRSAEKPDRTKPIGGVRVETSFREGDTFEIIDSLVTDIEALLRLGLGRSVSWVSICKLSGGAVVERYDAPRWAAPYGTNSQIISNIETGTLASYLESSYPFYIADRDWFIHTFTQFVVSLGASHLEIRMALQNTLLDRISSRILRHDETYEIDPAIPEKLTKPFRRRLHALFLELSPNWSSERTARVTQNIAEWNSGPSFPGAVERAAMRLALWPPAKAQIHKRHKLIHQGEYDAEDGTTPFEYWMHIEALVTMLLLRMLSYTGAFYAVSLGSGEAGLASMMIGGNRLPPYSIEPQSAKSLHRLIQVAAYLRSCGPWKNDPGQVSHWIEAEKAVKAIAPMQNSGNPGGKS